MTKRKDKENVKRKTKTKVTGAALAQQRLQRYGLNILTARKRNRDCRFSFASTKISCRSSC